jgi:hypothetical protein
MMNGRSMASESPNGPVKAFRHEDSSPAPVPLTSKPEHKAEGSKPFFSHPKSAPIRPADDSDTKKQHFVFLGNLMAAPESREAVIARQKQYFDQLSQQVQEKQQARETKDTLNSSNRLSLELQTINEELRQEREVLGRLRRKQEGELQVSGSAFAGGLLQRDEGALIRRKKEEQQREIQEALRRQIEEKRRKKEEERQLRLTEEIQQEKAIQEAQRQIQEDLDREAGKSPSKQPPTPDSPKEPLAQLFSTQTTIPRPPSLSPKDSHQQEELERLNSRVEEMQRSNYELMEKLKEQSQLILQIQEQKPSSSVPRPKPPLVRSTPVKDARRQEEQKRKEKHETENARIKAYELKIENARKKKEAMTIATRARQTTGLIRQSTYNVSERASPIVVPRMQSAFAGGASPLQAPDEAISASKLQSSRAFFGSMDSSPVHHQDMRQNLDTAGVSQFIYPKADGTFYPSGHDELDKLIESENQKLRRSPSIPDMAVSQTSQWVAVPRMDVIGHQSQMSHLSTLESDLKVSRFPRDVFGRKRP